jgi:hypothetical protein
VSRRASWHASGNSLLAGALVSYVLTLAWGGHNFLGTMLIVSFGLAAHIWAEK